MAENSNEEMTQNVLAGMAKKYRDQNNSTASAVLGVLEEWKIGGTSGDY